MSILDGALRQLKHNDGAEGFVFAYDKEITEREVARLEHQLAMVIVELAAARTLITEVENSKDSLPKGARYAIEWYRKAFPKC